MADTTIANSGEEFTNTPPNPIELTPDAQFRTLSRRLEEVADQVSRIEKQKTFRIADVIQLAAIAIALIVAIFTALGLKDRVDDLVKAQVGAETRLSAQITASENRVSGRLDKVDERLMKLTERTATLEGGRSTARSAPPRTE